MLTPAFERIEDAAVDDSIPVFSGWECRRVWRRRWLKAHGYCRPKVVLGPLGKLTFNVELVRPLARRISEGLVTNQFNHHKS